jgi:hypothetical protein
MTSSRFASRHREARDHPPALESRWPTTKQTLGVLDIVLGKHQQVLADVDGLAGVISNQGSRLSFRTSIVFFHPVKC